MNDTTARVLAGEIGLDMRRFLTSAHLISWVGLCPKLDENADKHRTRRIRKGRRGSRLVSAAGGAIRTKGSKLRRSLGSKSRGGAKAIIAVAASMLTAAFHITRDRVHYQVLSAEHFTKRNPKATKRLIKRLEISAT